MLYWLGSWLIETFGDGPYRLLTSRLVLSSLGLLMGLVTTWWAIPRAYDWLPRDRGRINTPDPEKARGKPTGAGSVFIPVVMGTILLIVPWRWEQLGILLAVGGALATGYLDDRARLPWSEYRKALFDLLIALVAAASLCELQPVSLWFPFFKGAFETPVWLYLSIAVPLLWISINATNCTDGVDGLSGSLLVLAYFFLGALLYLVVGHQEIAPYLLIPHDPLGSNWGVLAFSLIGPLAGYLWYNANPSQVLMGDAGSRPLGLLLGVLVLATGNPFLILVVAGVVLVNGGTGLVKVALLRFFKVGIFRNVRFPLHDHCKAKGWSPSQILIRFVLLQAILTPLLFVLVVKLR